MMIVNVKKLKISEADEEADKSLNLKRFIPSLTVTVTLPQAFEVWVCEVTRSIVCLGTALRMYSNILRTYTSVQ